MHPDNPPRHPQQPWQPHGYPAAPPPPPPRRRRRIWPWVLLGVAVLGFAGCATFVGAAGVAVNQATAPKTVVYSLEGDGGAQNVTWSSSNGQVAQQTSVDLPWKKEITFDNGLMAASVLSGQADGSSEITCRIVDKASGKVLAENTSSGQYAVVTCNGMPTP